MGTNRLSNCRIGTNGGFVRCSPALRGRHPADVGAGRRAGGAGRSARAAEEPGFFGSIGRWFDRAGIQNRFRLSRTRARRSRISATKPALPPRRRPKAPRTPPVRWRAFPTPAWSPATRNATNAPNGAPDCVAAASCHVQGQRLRIRQERRHDHRRGLPAASLSVRPQQRRRNATPRPSCPARSANRIFKPGLQAPAGACAAAAACVSVAPLRCGSAWREPLCQAARTRGRRPAGDRRPDRGRQVRHHVPVAGAADARHACRRRRRSRRGARAQPAQDRRLAGGSLCRDIARRCAQAAHDVGHRQRRGADRRSAHRGDRGGDRRAGRRHPSRACRRSPTASTSSWSMWKPTRWRGRCWRAAPRRPAWSTAWPGAISRR